MKRIPVYAGIVGMLMITGCDILSLNVVRVSLVNNSDYDVEATLLIHDQQEIPEVLLKEIGEQLEFIVPAGNTVSFWRDCDDLQAIMIEDADLLLIGELGPETDTGVLRDGDDFNCGSQIIFTFTHSDVILDFNVSTSVL